MSVPMVDLKTQYQAIQDEINSAVLGVIQSTHFILGPHGKALEEAVAAYHGVKHAIAVASGTDALHLALIAAGIKRGDEVITTPFTFIATAEAISYVGAVPVFVDIDPVSFNMDIRQVEAAITKKTRAIIPVHLYGQPVNMEPLMQIAKKHGLRVVEDCAQSFGAVTNGKKTGAIGDIGCFSFFPSKNLGCYGDGGMVITDDSKLAEQMLSLRNHGSRVRYYHDEIGFNSRLDEMQAAILRVKFKHIDEYNAKRRNNAFAYNSHLSAPGIQTPSEEKGTTHVFHQYTIKVKNRDTVKQRLDAGNVTSSMIYYPVPLHLQAAYRDLGIKPGSLPVAEQTALEVLSLPMYPELTEDQIRTVADAVKKAL
ncbi:MAG: erythromycin biosynthesis sensory transduction protein eryC1 [Nitrospirae bacterium GWC2_57_9]|nr:MAG: erythromycin biosynthesis sensory transduction protein eryC1 [Nitrospirae bacterium GWC2_57_9]